MTITNKHHEDIKETTTKKRRGRPAGSKNKTTPSPSDPPTPEDAKKLTPSEYFEYIKSKKHEMTEEKLRAAYENMEALAKRFAITGQTKAVEKLKFLEECFLLEMPVVKAGYTQYVERWVLEDYINNLTDKCVFIQEMKNYERDFPDEVIEEILKAKEVFGDNLYVVFTDYTKKEARKVAKSRREKDPILFGALSVETRGHTKVILDRLYYICDWIDEFCDLTLDNLVSDYKNLTKDKSNRILHNVPRLDRRPDLDDAMKNITENEDGNFVDIVGTDTVVGNTVSVATVVDSNG